MRFSKAVLAAVACLATVDGFKFQLHRSLDVVDTVGDLAKRATTTISTNFKFSASQFSYYVDVSIGSAHSFIRLRLSSDPFTWFPGPLPSAKYCATQTVANFDKCIESNWSGTFDPETSTTFKNLSTVLNLTGSDPRYYVVGYYGQDTIQIGQTPITDVPIGIGVDYTRIPTLGLGLDGSGSTENSLLRQMYENKLIEVIAYGLYLNDYDANSSEMTIGAIDTAKFEGNLITFDSPGDTNVQVVSLEYDGGTGDLVTLATGWNANIEFSTGLIYFPDGPLQAIIADIDAYYDSAYGGYLTECSNRFGNKALRFNFDGMNITVTASQWIVPAITVTGYQTTLKDGETLACIALVDSMEKNTIATKLGYDAVLGTPFVRGTYLVHDFTNEQTSFAQAKLNTSDSEIKSLNTDGVAPFATPAPSTTVTPNNNPQTTSGSATSAPPAGTNTGNGEKKTPVGAIAGGTVGGVAVIGLAIGIFFFLRKRQDKTITPESAPPAPGMHENAAAGQYGHPAYNNGNGQYPDQYKGLAPQSPGMYGNQPHTPTMSEMGGSPIDPNAPRYSQIIPAGAAELPTPRNEHAPVELPGH